MKDKHDKQTGDLLASDGARRQAAFKARKEAQGYRRATVWMHEASWKAGFEAGMAGNPPMPVPDGIDGLSWFSGYVEGDAGRLATQGKRK